MSAETHVYPVSRLMAAARRGLALFLVAGVAACASLQTPEPEPQPSKPIARVSPEDAADASVGAKEHPRLVAAFGGDYRDDKIARMLARVVSTLVPVSERPELRYQVTVLDSPSVNAFALPGGYLYVTRGLLALASEESEIAAVLAHEMAHITARHAAQREEKAKTAMLASRVVAEVMRDNEAGVAALASSQMTLAGFSRQQEMEADAIGIATVSEAGYDPRAAVRFLVAMGRQATLDAARLNPAGRKEEPNFLASHPSTPERIERATALAEALARETRPRRSDRDIYLAAIDGLLYGDTSVEGFVRGRRFLHTELGFSFEAPTGFVLENSSKAVFGVGPNGEALRFDGASVAGNGPPIDLVAGGWIEGAEVDGVRPIIVDGLPGATGLAKAGEWTFRLGAVRRGDTVYRFVLGAKSFNERTDTAFLDAIRSFRRLSPQEAQSASPLRIRSVTVREGDTLATLADRMGFEDRKLERFMVLNGLRAGDTLPPGSLVKIVAED